MKVTAQSGAAFARQNDLEFASALDSGFSHAGWKPALNKGIDVLQVPVNMATHHRIKSRNCLAVLSHKQQAFEWLKIAYREHDTLRLIALKTDFILDSLRSDPRYVDLLRRIGVPK
jgi:hypothetical protein